MGVSNIRFKLALPDTDNVNESGGDGDVSSTVEVSSSDLAVSMVLDVHP